VEITASGLSDVGLKREGNEDYFSIEDPSSLYVVADGMGGHLAGEVASRVAVEMINKSFNAWLEQKTSIEGLYGDPDPSLTIRGNYISSGIRLANRVIYEMALDHEEYQGMGTTVSMIHVIPDLVIAANVGDSRIYLIRSGRIERLSKDHTLVSEQVEMGMMTEEEAETSPLKHILTRNLGSSEDVEPDIYEIQPFNHDRFVLCSDGLTDLVSDEEILEMTCDENEPEILCRRFIETALQRGGHDNTTAISVFLSDLGARKSYQKKRYGGFLSNIFSGARKTKN
jgi:protein phosphatase